MMSSRSRRASSKCGSRAVCRDHGEVRLEGNAKLLREHSEDLCGATKDRFDRSAASRKLLEESITRLRVEGRQADEAVHVDPVGHVRGYPASRRVRMEEVALILQVAHRVADGGRGDANGEAPRDHARSRRLSSLYVGLNDRLEHPTLSVAEL